MTIRVRRPDRTPDRCRRAAARSSRHYDTAVIVTERSERAVVAARQPVSVSLYSLSNKSNQIKSNLLPGGKS
jgi:hypothetical protein